LGVLAIAGNRSLVPFDVPIYQSIVAAAAVTTGRALPVRPSGGLDAAVVVFGQHHDTGRLRDSGQGTGRLGVPPRRRDLVVRRIGGEGIAADRQTARDSGAGFIRVRRRDVVVGTHVDAQP